MRLIDTDAMNEELFYKQLGGKDTLITAECAFNMIKAQPTAYDVEKVVAELEEEAKDTCMEVECSRYRACCYCRGVKSTIDIVRKGGVE